VRFITLQSAKFYTRTVGEELEVGGRVLQAFVKTKDKPNKGQLPPKRDKS
jgi:hypothetical protein